MKANTYDAKVNKNIMLNDIPSEINVKAENITQVPVSEDSISEQHS